MRFIVTNAGLNLLSSLVASKKLIFTRAEAGDTVSSSPSNLAMVQSKKQDISIENIIEKNGIRGLSLSLSNVGVRTEYRLRQIGVYAKVEEGEEVLFLVGQDEIGELIPDIDSRQVETDYEVYFNIGNSYQMELNISSESYVKRALFNESIEPLKEKMTKLEKVRELTLRANAWQGSRAPFSIDIRVENIKVSDNLIASPKIEKGATKDYKKACECIDGFESLNGYIRFYCNYKKPSKDIKVLVRGV